MGDGYSKPLPRGRMDETGRDSPLLSSLRKPRGNHPLSLVEFESYEDMKTLLVGRQPTSSASHQEVGNINAETRQARQSQESHIEELTGSLSQGEDELQSLQQNQERQRDEEAADYRTQIDQLEARVLELTESRAAAEHELQQKQEMTATLQQRDEEAARYRTQIAQLLTQVVELTESRTAAENELELLQQKQEKMAATLQQRDKEAATQIAQLEAQVSKLQDHISELNDSRSHAEIELHKLQQRHDDVTAVLKQKEEERASYFSRIVELEGQISELTGSLSQAESELESLQQEQQIGEASLQGQISQLQGHISDLTDSRSRAESELDKLQQQLDEVTAALKQREEEQAGYRSQITQLNEQISELTESQSRARSELKSLQQKQRKMALTLQQRHKEEDNYRTQIGQLNAQVVELTERRVAAERELETVRMQHSKAEASLCAQVSELKAQISQHNKSESALRSQVVQQQELISEMKSSLAECEKSRSQAERALGQLQEQHERLKRNAQEDVQGLQPSSEPVTLKALVNEVIEVTDWFHFGINLDIPYYELANISSAFPDGAHRKTHMLIRWMQLNENPSWSAIVAALMKIRMRRLAQRLAVKYGVPIPPEDSMASETQPGAIHSEESQSVNAQVLAEIQTISEKLEECTGKLNNLSDSLDEARSDQQRAYDNTLSAKEAAENGLIKVKNLTERRILIEDQLRARERDLSFLQQFLDYHLRENKELKVTIEARKEEIDNLRRSLGDLECEVKSARHKVEVLTDQLHGARRELEASCSRVQELERERAELQAEVNRERRKVDLALIQKAATFPTQESAQEIEYQHDQALELLSESSGLEEIWRQEDSQREDQVQNLLAGARELENLRLTWYRRSGAPEPLFRGSAVTDVDQHRAYFSDYHTIYAYEWQREEWSKLPECPHPNHTLAIVSGLLTAVGGIEFRRPTNTLYSLVGDGSNRKWEQRFPPMPTKRGYTTVVCSGKHLVVAGGRDDVRVVPTVEVMDTETQRWFTASSLPLSLLDATATIVGNRIYLVGGDVHYDMNKSVLTCSLDTLFQSCQPHSPQPQSPSPSLWQQVADTPFYWSSCVTLSGELVAVGGCDPPAVGGCESNKNPTDAVYAYNPAKNSWDVISRMNTSQWQCLAVVLPGDRVMVVGGYTPSKSAAVEVGLTY